MTDWTTSDQDTMGRIVFHQRAGWRITSPTSSGAEDGRWHAGDGTTDLAAWSVDALLDQLDWFQAS